MEPIKVAVIDGASVSLSLRARIVDALKEGGIGAEVLIVDGGEPPKVRNLADELEKTVRWRQFESPHILSAHIRRPSPEVEAWNREVDRKKAEKKARRNR